MFLLKQTLLFNGSLDRLNDLRLLISTINAHSYNTAQKDQNFAESLLKSDVLLPDGISVVWAKRLLSGDRLKKIAGADLFRYEMERMEQNSGKVFFLGSNKETLTTISERAAREYPNVTLGLYSPPYKEEFTVEDNQAMITAVNAFEPNVLFIGMTAPKQEKWAYKHFNQLNAGHVCCIGAVFDFYAGTVKRAPKIFIKLGLEWFYRLLAEPRRMWKRYLIGNVVFIGLVLKEKYLLIRQKAKK